jgi:hypothetical protein
LRSRWRGWRECPCGGSSLAARGQAPGTAAPSRLRIPRCRTGRAPPASSRVGTSLEAPAGWGGGQHERSRGNGKARPCTMRPNSTTLAVTSASDLAAKIADRRGGYQQGAHHGGKSDGDENERQDDGEVGRTHAPRGAQRIVLGQHEDTTPKTRNRPPASRSLALRRRIANPPKTAAGWRIYPITAAVSAWVPASPGRMIHQMRLTYAWPTATFLASKCLGPAQSHRFHVTCSAISRVAWLSVQSRSWVSPSWCSW